MNSVHNGLSITARVKTGQSEALNTLLEKLEQQDQTGTYIIPFDQMDSVHFVSIIQIEEERGPDGVLLPQRLIILTSYTGSRRNHIRELVSHGHEGWHQIFQYCEGYSATESKPALVKRYLKKHTVHNTYYTGFHYVTKAAVGREEALRQSIQEFLDNQWQDPNFAQLSGKEVRHRIQTFVKSQPELQWATQPYRKSFGEWFGVYGPLTILSLVMGVSFLLPVISLLIHHARWNWTAALWWAAGIGLGIHLILPLLTRGLASEQPKGFSIRGFLIRLGVSLLLSFSLVSTIWALIHYQSFWPAMGVVFWAFVLGLLILLLLFRIDESKPFQPIEDASDERIFEIASKENNPVNNEMSVIGPLKQGWIRRIFLAVTLRLVPLVRGFSYIPTVHTARWLQVDGGRRIVFIAYFDNTSEGYAHDFVDSTKRTRNLNLIFGHGMGFPATKYAVIGGAKDRRQYMRAVRANQKITNVWYRTHPKLSILNITQNRAIRKGLYGKLKSQELDQWLALF